MTLFGLVAGLSAAFLLTWFGLALFVGLVAGLARKRSFLGWFLLACVISPLLAIILLLAMPRRETWRDRRERDRRDPSYVGKIRISR
jgi:uncharacterized membrane protein YhdT